jgi:hypothetical protein
VNNALERAERSGQLGLSTTGLLQPAS